MTETKTVDFITGAKGGIGKTFLSAALTQFYRSKGFATECFSTDYAHEGLLAYKDLTPVELSLTHAGDVIKERFEGYLDSFISDAYKGIERFVVDNGGSSSYDFLNFVRECGSDVLGSYRGIGLDIRIHTIISAGASYGPCCAYLCGILENTAPDEVVVVWLNPYFGEVGEESVSSRIVPFTDSEIYRKNKDRLCVIGLPEYSGTIRRYMARMAQNGETFEKACLEGSTHLNLANKAILHELPRIYKVFEGLIA